jgi:hypothetical protein
VEEHKGTENTVDCASNFQMLLLLKADSSPVEYVDKVAGLPRSIPEQYLTQIHSRAAAS